MGGRLDDNGHKRGWWQSRREGMAVITASWLFYTAPMGCLEYYVGGLNNEEIVKSRVVAGGFQIIASPLVEKARRYIGDNIEVHEGSSRLKKAVANAGGVLMMQPFVYNGVLFTSDALSNMTIGEYSSSLLGGLGIALATAPLYCSFSDWWRKKLFKLPSVFRKKPNIEEIRR